MGLEGEPLPLLWTCDYIPKNPEGWSKAEKASDAETEYVVGEFNCSCVGISMFQAVCGGEKTLADVPDADYFEASKLTSLMGVKARAPHAGRTDALSRPPPPCSPPLAHCLLFPPLRALLFSSGSSSPLIFSRPLSRWPLSLVRRRLRCSTRPGALTHLRRRRSRPKPRPLPPPRLLRLLASQWTSSEELLDHLEGF